MATTDVTTIRARMARIRSRAQGKAVRLSQETKRFLDWKHYVRLFPWGIVGAAAVVGYLIVPARQTAPVEAGTSQPNPPAAPPPPPPQAKQAGLVSSLFSVAANAVMRSAVSYAGQAVGQYLANLQQQSTNPQPPRERSEHERYSVR